MPGDEPVHRFDEPIHDRQPREASEDPEPGHDVGDPDDSGRARADRPIGLDHMESGAEVA